MKTSKLTGWGKVFYFTLQQNLKTGTTRVFLLIFLLIGMVSMPLMEKLMPANSAPIADEIVMEDVDADTEPLTPTTPEASPIENIYVFNDTDLPLENLDEFMKLFPEFKGIETEFGNVDADTYLEDKTNLGNNSLHVTLSMDETGLSVFCEAPLKSYIETEELQAFEYSFVQYLEVKKLEWAGLSAEQVATLQTPMNGSILHVDENGEEVSEGMTFNNGEYWVSYGIILISIFIIAISAEGIAVSVLTEKSSKIVEYLMMSVKPLALIVGKTLAMLLVVIIQFAVLFAGMAISCVINGFMKNETVSFVPAESMKQFFSLDLFSAVNPGVILLVILIIVAGVIFYCTLAGIAGASVSRMEEIGEALKLYNIVMIIGAYFGLGIAMSSAMGASAINYVAYLLPISSPFILPVHLVLGKAPIWIAVVSLAILIVMIILTFMLASKIYGNMLFYNGKPMKIKEMIRFFKDSKSSGKEIQ